MIVLQMFFELLFEDSVAMDNIQQIVHTVQKGL